MLMRVLVLVLGETRLPCCMHYHRQVPAVPRVALLSPLSYFLSNPLVRVSLGAHGHVNATSSQVSVVYAAQRLGKIFVINHHNIGSLKIPKSGIKWL